MHYLCLLRLLAHSPAYHNLKRLLKTLVEQAFLPVQQGLFLKTRDRQECLSYLR